MVLEGLTGWVLIGQDWGLGVNHMEGMLGHFHWVEAHEERFDQGLFRTGDRAVDVGDDCVGVVGGGDNDSCLSSSHSGS